MVTSVALGVDGETESDFCKREGSLPGKERTLGGRLEDIKRDGC